MELAKGIMLDITASDREYYSHFFSRCEWLKNHTRTIRHTLHGGRESQNSFCFGKATSPDESLASLQKVFPCLTEPGIAEKFKEAACGKGTEWKRINRLHSSALLSFLMFCRVSPEHPLTLKLPNARPQTFTEVHFEIKNWLQDKDPAPSNIDVVLVNDKSVVFIESKFTEYFKLEHTLCDYAAERYAAIFSEVFKDWKCDPKMTALASDDYVFFGCSSPHYCDGLKQMVAHWMGLRYAKSRHAYGGKNPIKIAGRQLYLASVLFDFNGIMFGEPGRKAVAALNDYRAVYSELVQHLPHLAGVTVFPEVLTYQQLAAQLPLDADIRGFYQLPA